MTAPLTSDQISAIEALPPGVPLELRDEKSQRSYILFDKQAYDAWVWQQVQMAADDDAEEEWDVESVRREAQQILASQDRGTK